MCVCVCVFLCVYVCVNIDVCACVDGWIQRGVWVLVSVCVWNACVLLEREEGREEERREEDPVQRSRSERRQCHCARMGSDGEMPGGQVDQRGHGVHIRVPEVRHGR